MKHKTLIISIFCVFSVHSNAQTVKCDSLSIRFIGERDSNFEFELINNTQDTLHLFDSYLNEGLYKSKYLHRFDTETKQCKLSLLPLLPYLSVNYTDAILLGENKVINQGQVLYHFKIIPPNSKNRFAISKSAFYSEDYVEEIYPQKISKFDKIKFRESKYKKCSVIVVEFALYKNIDSLSSEEAYYFDEFNFNEQALSYIVLSVSVPTYQ